MIKCQTVSEEKNMISSCQTFKDTLHCSVTCECCDAVKYNITIDITYSQHGGTEGIKELEEIVLSLKHYGKHHYFNARDPISKWDAFVRNRVANELYQNASEDVRKQISDWIITRVIVRCAGYNIKGLK